MAPLSMFCLDARELNTDLRDRAQALSDTITMCVMKKNWEVNEG